MFHLLWNVSACPSYYCPSAWERCSLSNSRRTYTVNIFHRTSWWNAFTPWKENKIRTECAEFLSQQGLIFYSDMFDKHKLKSSNFTGIVQYFWFSYQGVSRVIPLSYLYVDDEATASSQPAELRNQVETASICLLLLVINSNKIYLPVLLKLELIQSNFWFWFKSYVLVLHFLCYRLQKIPCVN